MTHEEHNFSPAHAPLHRAEDQPLEDLAAAPDRVAPSVRTTSSAPNLPDIPSPAATSPDVTAEIDVQAVEQRLSDPGSTQSFEPVTDDMINADSTYNAGTSTTLMWGARSDVGCVRSHNEDSYLIQPPLFCVCDGMGGHAAGEVASSIAVETIAKTAPKTADPALLAAAVEAANTAVITAAQTGRGKPGMGCTATCAFIEGTTLAIAHVGDSRAYLLHEGTLIRVTRDHSYVEELVDAGEITADEARVHPNRSVITRALGSDPNMYADHFALNMEMGDRLILCSDGMSGMLPDDEIESIAVQSATAQMCTDNLVDAALAAGGSDNVTVVVADLVDDGERQKLQRRRVRRGVVAGAAVLVVLALAAVISYAAITTSYFLGVNGDTVAIYQGVYETFLGFDLYWLEDETSIKVSDLPEDTQRRLQEGIGQDSLEDALETISSYRQQIDDAQTKLIEDTETIQQGAVDASSSSSDEEASDDAASSSTSSSSDESEESPANTVAPTTSSAEGGTTQ